MIRLVKIMRSFLVTNSMANKILKLQTIVLACTKYDKLGTKPEGWIQDMNSQGQRIEGWILDMNSRG